MKVKRLEEVKEQKDKTLSEIKRDFKVMTILMIVLIVLALIACFQGMKLAIDYDALKLEKEALEELIEIQNIKVN